MKRVSFIRKKTISQQLRKNFSISWNLKYLLFKKAQPFQGLHQRKMYKIKSKPTEKHPRKKIELGTA